MSWHRKKGRNKLVGVVTNHDWPTIDKMLEYKGLHSFFQKLKKKPKTFLDLVELWLDSKDKTDGSNK